MSTPLMQQDTIVATVAGMGVTSPVWVPWVETLNSIGALVLTLLGIGIAVITLYSKLKRRK
jgi:hypothetical protein